jgi:plasmid maintenance system antidote protein VapI
METTRKRITQRKIAREAQIGPDFLSHIIRGRRRCPPPVALRLEEATGISRITWVWGNPEEIRAAVEKVCRNDLR